MKMQESIITANQKVLEQRSCIQETPNLSTDADRITAINYICFMKKKINKKIKNKKSRGWEGGCLKLSCTDFGFTARQFFQPIPQGKSEPSILRLSLGESEASLWTSGKPSYASSLIFVTWGPMRGLKKNGSLLCSPGTSFAPLGLDGANTQTDRQT